ncbi:MAG: NAD-dependent epimerase/dehydratase family protein [Candidatus Schekmanbacteria bacterium]|nr:NAD-dependent epimerase/dehydratase family protein [Candidatus Schekmanbacteria bacterium]
MKLLVTGGAGFIGSNIVDAAILSGYKVAVVDDLSTGYRENLHPAAVFYHVDINSPQMREVFEKERPDCIAHHAAQMDVRHSVADPANDANINILGSIRLLQLAAEFKVKKLLFASTGGAIYGEQEVYPAPENHPCNPVSPYGISKLTVEKYLYFYYLNYGLGYTCLRYANVYGPRQNPHGEAGVVAIFCQKMLGGGQPLIFGDGKQTRDYVYVEDVVSANLAALKSDYNGVLNIGTARETDVNQIFQTVKKFTGSACSQTHAPAKPGEQRRSVIDPGKAKEILNWQPQIVLEEGLQKTVEFFKKKRLV